MNVNFLKGTEAAYKALSPVATNFYYLTDTNKLYLGSVELTNTTSHAEVEALASRVAVNETDLTTLKSVLNSFLEGGADAVKNYIDAVDAKFDDLADVATTGAAADVSVADEGGLLTATNVEAALAEIIAMIGSGGADAAVTVTKTTGTESDDFVTKYTFAQGGNPITNGEITIGKDMVATSGELVNQDDKGNTGTFIKMTIANGTPFYIDVADLIEYNSVESTTEVTLSDANHKISATIGEIAASKIIYKEADEQAGTPKQTVAQAINALETAATTGVDNKITAAINNLDSDVTVADHKIITAIHQVDGELSSVDTEVLDAQYVSYTSNEAGAQATTVKAALDANKDAIAAETARAQGVEATNAAAAAAAQSDVDALETLVGTLPAGAEATTIVGYIDEKTGEGVNALNGSATIASKTGNVVTLKAGITETAGIVSNNSDADIALAAVAVTGAAANVSVADAGDHFTGTDVETVLGEIADQLTWQDFPA